MPIDPVTGALIANTAGGFLGGLFGSGEAAKQRKLDKRQTQLSEELGRRGAVMGEGAQANEYGRQLDMLGLRDRMIHNLTARMGYGPQGFKPRDVFNPGISAGTPQLGGIPLNELASKYAGYTPGTGGVQSGNIATSAMETLGYKPDGSYMSPRYRHDIQTGGVDPYGIGQHGYQQSDRTDFVDDTQSPWAKYKKPTPWDRYRSGGSI